MRVQALGRSVVVRVRVCDLFCFVFLCSSSSRENRAAFVAHFLLDSFLAPLPLTHPLQLGNGARHSSAIKASFSPRFCLSLLAPSDGRCCGRGRGRGHRLRGARGARRHRPRGRKVLVARFGVPGTEEGGLSSRLPLLLLLLLLLPCLFLFVFYVCV